MRNQYLLLATRTALFSLVCETDSEIPSKGTSPFTAMGEITVDPKEVLKLLNGLKVHKAPGPDGLSARVLKECSEYEIDRFFFWNYSHSSLYLQ